MMGRVSMFDVSVMAIRTVRTNRTNKAASCDAPLLNLHVPTVLALMSGKGAMEITTVKMVQMNRTVKLDQERTHRQVASVVPMNLPVMTGLA